MKQERKWQADPWLDEQETLEPDDYKSAHESLKVDRGHQAPLASFKGTDDWQETNYLSNITPQKSELNQCPWEQLESKVRNLAKANVVYVMTCPLYERNMSSLSNADEPHKIPSGYWQIILVQTSKSVNSIKSASFIFEQNTPKTDKVIEHLSTINEIERRSKLDFLWELPDNIEEQIESDKFQEWAEQKFE